MRFYLHAEADAELDAAVSYYEEQEAGLGVDFAEEVYATIARISVYPEAWTPFSKHTRRCLLNRFPYGIVYRVKAEIVEVIAVANLQRRPGFWKNRV